MTEITAFIKRSQSGEVVRGISLAEARGERYPCTQLYRTTNPRKDRKIGDGTHCKKRINDGISFSVLTNIKTIVLH